MLLVIILLINWSFYLLMVHDIKTMYLQPVAWRLALIGGVSLFFYQNSLEQVIYAAQRVFVFSVGFLAFYRLAKGYVYVRRKQQAEGIGQ